MLGIKDFEKAMQPVSQEDLLRRKARGQYIPYIEAILRKAKTMPVGKSVEVDILDPKKAAGLAMSMRGYFKKMKIDGYAAGNYKTFVFCGKRTAEKNGGK